MTKKRKWLKPATKGKGTKKSALDSKLQSTLKAVRTKKKAMKGK